MIQHPKFFLFDAGVFRAVRPRGPLDTPAEIDGASLETLVLQHLRAVMPWRNSDGTISYWRTSTGLEVDFVVYSADAFAAIEVKREACLCWSESFGRARVKGEMPPENQRSFHPSTRRTPDYIITSFQRGFRKIC